MKSNKKFMMLSAIGIIMVLDDHAGTSLKLFSNIFPYNSFYMPMFVFISGYFFQPEKTENLKFYLFKKSKTFLIPYLIYNFFYQLLNEFICGHSNIDWISSDKNFFRICWTYGTPVDIASPGWFVMMLFHIVCLYAVIRKSLSKIWNDNIVLLICVIFGTFSVYISHNNLFPDHLVLLVKIIFFIQFYQLGICYKMFYEKKILRIPYGYILLLCSTINILCFSFYGENISFSSCAFMHGFFTDNYILPLLTSITGILFWLIISEKILCSLYNNKYINFISNNTFFIMMNHLAFYNILNVIYLLVHCDGFDQKAFYQSAWYKYLPISDTGGGAYIIFALFLTYFIKNIQYLLVDLLKKYRKEFIYNEKI